MKLNNRLNRLNKSIFSCIIVLNNAFLGVK